ncbi:MAG: hypothetical protein J4G12_00135 [Gemmatimonadetes bacterium]|nr:hypothetical protein [Gemmatimonadota bacterium]
MDRKKIFDRARDELFSHINNCGVLEAAQDAQGKWMEETIEYIGERYETLDQKELTSLFEIGTRFCEPPIVHPALR